MSWADSYSGLNINIIASHEVSVCGAPPVAPHAAGAAHFLLQLSELSSVSATFF